MYLKVTVSPAKFQWSTSKKIKRISSQSPSEVNASEMVSLWHSYSRSHRSRVLSLWGQKFLALRIALRDWMPSLFCSVCGACVASWCVHVFNLVCVSFSPSWPGNSRHVHSPNLASGKQQVSSFFSVPTVSGSLAFSVCCLSLHMSFSILSWHALASVSIFSHFLKSKSNSFWQEPFSSSKQCVVFVQPSHKKSQTKNSQVEECQGNLKWKFLKWTQAKIFQANAPQKPNQCVCLYT